MDVFLKKYFWVVDLLAVGLCAGLGGRASSHLIEQNWLFADDLAAGATVAHHVVPPEKTRSKDVERIVKRNVFCSTCVAAPPPDTSAPMEPLSNDPVKCNLPLELVSTMYVPDDERWSIAVIRDVAGKEKEARSYNKGKSVPGGAIVMRVDPKKVYLNNGGRIEYLEIEGAGEKKTPAGESPMAYASQAGMEPIDQKVQRGVKCNGSACEIERGLVDELLANTTSLATAARFVPSVKDGRPNGFKLYAIRPSSIFGKISLQNGDTVKSINGMEMSSPDQALGVYTKLRSASHLTVSVERHGENITLDYTIR